MSFDNIIGNNRIKNDLRETIENNVISHSYLFVGQEGIGKKKTAEEFAKSLLCLSDKKGCDSCSSCIKFNSYNNPDFIKIEPEGNSIKIAQIREMQENVYQKPIISNRKIIIINDSDKMTEEAQNSLLKTLEEPPEYIVIILISSNEYKLLNTVRSRCLKISFTNLNETEIIEYIKKNNIIQNPSKNILNMCNGSIGRLTQINENMEEYNKIEDVTSEFVCSKISNIVNMFNKFEILYKSKDIINQLLDYMIVIVYGYIRENEDYRIKFLNIISIIEQTKGKLLSNVNYDMCIDDLLMKIWATCDIM